MPKALAIVPNGLRLVESKPKVLIVDDEPVIAHTLEAILRKSGFDARGAHSGENAVEIAHQWGPDALVTDIILGGISGIETALRVRSLAPHCRVILMSGHAVSSELLNEAGDRGDEFDVLAKPFYPTELIDKLRAATSHAA